MSNFRKKTINSNYQKLTRYYFLCGVICGIIITIMFTMIYKKIFTKKTQKHTINNSNTNQLKKHYIKHQINSHSAIKKHNNNLNKNNHSKLTNDQRHSQIQDNDNNYEFYNLTNNYNNSIQEKENSSKYILEVGEFNKVSDADELKARLALIGFEAKIETITSKNQLKIFKVSIGPFNSQSSAIFQKNKLYKLGIQKVLIKNL